MRDPGFRSSLEAVRFFTEGFEHKSLSMMSVMVGPPEAAVRAAA